MFKKNSVISGGSRRLLKHLCVLVLVGTLGSDRRDTLDPGTVLVLVAIPYPNLAQYEYCTVQVYAAAIAPRSVPAIQLALAGS